MSLGEKIFSPLVREELKTEWRGREVSRIEGFSDAVFGFAVTLLIVALKVPRTSGELLEAMKGFGAFVITFTLLFSIWYKQFVFFRKYGLEDRTAVILNGALIVVVLFFVYPLKFIAGVLVNRVLGFGRFTLLTDGTRVPLGRAVTLADGNRVLAILPHDFPLLMSIYGFGFGAVFLVFGLLYRHAYSKREALSLTPVEAYDTRESMLLFFWVALIGAMSGVYNLVSELPALSGNTPAQLVFAAILIAPIVRMFRLRATRRSRRERFLIELSAK